MSIYKKLGPGLLYAGAAIGVSHLVQSTRAGALYGFDLAFMVFLVHLIKYPFFEISARFTVSERKSLLEGFGDLHWSLLAFFVLQTFLTMFIVQSAVTVVTAGIFLSVTGLNISLASTCVLLFLLLGLVLYQKKVAHLETVMKPIMFFLVLSTAGAFLFSFSGTFASIKEELPPFDWTNKKDLLFLVAFIGWMPSPLDGSVWHSIWASDEKTEGERRTLSFSLFDLRFSYALIMVLAFMFLSLGAFVMHESGKSFSSGAVAFSTELIGLYRASLGDIASFVVSCACLMTMVSTTLGCWDIFARVMGEGTFLLVKKKSRFNYFFYLVLIALGTLVIVSSFLGSMKSLVDFATVMAFVVSPLIAFLSLAILYNKKLAEKKIFPPWLKIFSLISAFLLLFFSLFSLTLFF